MLDINLFNLNNKNIYIIKNKMSLILEKSKKIQQKIKNLENLKRNFNKPHNKSNQNKHSRLNNSNPPRQKSYAINDKEKHKKLNELPLLTEANEDLDDMNNLLSTKNDHFSRSVIFTNKKNMANNLFPLMKRKKYNDILFNKNPRAKILNIKKEKYSKNKNRSFGSGKHANNLKIKKNKFNNLNISGDLNGGYVISKFEEKFKLIDNEIVDKNYENDIDNDEIIIGNNKNKKSSNNMNSLLNKISPSNKNIVEHDEIDTFFTKNKDEEYDINNNFENIKSDFGIMYIDEYDKMINDDMLVLELQLLFEKILDLENSYHEEYANFIKKLHENKNFISLITDKYKETQKKIFNLSKIKENINNKNELNLFLVTQEKEKKSYITEINGKEINLWENMFKNKLKKINSNNDFIDRKSEMKNLFIKIIFDKYPYMKNFLNEIQNKIVMKLMKKYNYKVLNNRKNKSQFINNNNSIKNEAVKNMKSKNNKHKIIKSDIYGNNNNINKSFMKNYKFNSLNYNNPYSIKKKY